MPSKYATDDTLSIQQAARLLGISSSLAYELAAGDKFPCRIVKAGRRYIVPRVELERLLGVSIRDRLSAGTLRDA